MTPEVVQLVAVLDAQRDHALKMLAGLTEAEARQSTVASGTNLAGLLQHLTFVESKWFEQIAGGGKATRGRRTMTVDPSISLRALRAEYREACDASNAIVARLGDGDAPIADGGRVRTLRSVLLAVIEETARHLGHADIIREQIGRTRSDAGT